MQRRPPHARTRHRGPSTQGLRHNDSQTLQWRQAKGCAAWLRVVSWPSAQARQQLAQLSQAAFARPPRGLLRQPQHLARRSSCRAPSQQPLRKGKGVWLGRGGGAPCPLPVQHGLLCCRLRHAAFDPAPPAQKRCSGTIGAKACEQCIAKGLEATCAPVQTRRAFSGACARAPTRAALMECDCPRPPPRSHSHRAPT